MVSTSTVRSASGAMVYFVVDGEGERWETELADPWDVHVQFIPKLVESSVGRWGLSICVASRVDSMLESWGSERARFSLEGGEVVVADFPGTEDMRWAAWQGPWHAVHGFFYAPDWEQDNISETFSRVGWVDTPEGMMTSPGPNFEIISDWCELRIPGVGTLSVTGTELELDLPRWRGATVPSGEVWQLPDVTGGDQPGLLWASSSSSAVATLTPFDASLPGTDEPTGRSGAGTTQYALDFLSTSVRSLDWVR